MKNRYHQIIPLFLLTFSLVFISCSDDNGNGPDPVETASVYVTNEGNFGDSNGSLTSYEPDDGTTLQAAFEDANGRPLAGIIQAARLVDGRLYLALNNANKVEVLDAQTLESVDTTSFETTPSAIEVVDEETAYVGNLYSGSISVLDLTTMEVADQTIAVGSQPRSIVRVGNKAYVANNGAGEDNTISVIDIGNNTVTQTIEVGAGPTQIVADAENRLWVVCNGLIAYDENWQRDPESDLPGSVYILNSDNGTIINSIETGGHPTGIAINNDDAEAYLLNQGVSVIDMNTFDVRENFIDRSFNAIGYFPLEQYLYLGQSRGYDQEGQALIYDLQGTPIDSFSVGIAPNGFHFN